MLVDKMPEFVKRSKEDGTRSEDTDEDPGEKRPEKTLVYYLIFIYIFEKKIG